MNFGTKCLSQPLVQPTRNVLGLRESLWLDHSKCYCNTQQSTNDFAVASDCTEYVAIGGTGQRSAISHLGWFSEMHFRAACGQRTSQAILLERGQYQPCP